MTRAVVACLVVAVWIAGCGGDDGERAAAAAPPPTLPAAAIPYLESKQRSLTVAAVAKETGLPRLASQLADWGYESGASRYFQGQSRHLQVVDSRAYRFRSATGAAALMRTIRAQPGAFFPGAGKARAISVAGRGGIAVDGLPCACHLAQPALFAALADGATVHTLEINGARATRRVLRALAARAL